MGIQKTFAINMRRLRKSAGLTQEELAEKSGLHRTYIGGIEQQRVNVSLKNVEKIAHALGVDPSLLFFRSDEDRYGRSVPQPNLQKDEWALCKWTDEGMTVQPIEVENLDITVQVLCSLIGEGHQGADLARQYHVAQEEILRFLKLDRH